MKIYFAGSIRGGRNDAQVYKQIVDWLKSEGHNVLSEHIALQSLTDAGNAQPADEIYRQDTNWIRECDIVIAEVTQPSLGVGYELGFAESLQKPIVCLWSKHAEKRLSAMVTGNASNTVIEYDTFDSLREGLVPLLDT